MNAARHVLGLSAFYHDSAAAIVRDGEIVGAVQEERFSRRKHDRRFPSAAINYCLEAAWIEPAELTSVVFYDNPILSLDRILATMSEAGAAGEALWCRGAPEWLSVKLFVEELVRRELNVDVPVLFGEHHLSHAASAFYPSPFEEAAFLTIDGVGEWTTTMLGRGDAQGLEVLEEIEFPHSLGLLYSAFTHYCGFKVNSGEYKLMGLAPYGTPRFADRIREHLIDVRPDGSYRLQLAHFAFTREEAMISQSFADLLGAPARTPESRITRHYMDVAASIQAVTEEVVLALARHLREATGSPNLVMAGGVALNCVANGRLLREGVFERCWFQPASGDAGGALGAALLGCHVHAGVPRPPVDAARDRQQGSYLGPAWSNGEVRAFLDECGYPYEIVDDAERAERVAAALADDKVVGYMVGRMEFGPRSLGARSILGDARSATAQTNINLKIKFRESFRPFAPSVTREHAAEWFELDVESPYMMIVAPVRAELCIDAAKDDTDDMLAVVNRPRSSIPAVTHVDHSARVQTVDAAVKPDFHAVLEAFRRRTGVPVVVNTSFNVRGEPIVCSPQDAYRCFMRTNMDVLVLENAILYREQQPAFADDADWQGEYELD